MTLPTASTERDDPAFESDVRTMLARRAGDVSPSPATERPPAALTLGHPPAPPIPLAPRRLGRARRARVPALAAAAAAVVVVGALATGGNRAGRDRTATGGPAGTPAGHDPALPTTYLTGSYAGSERFGFTTGRCPDLDHTFDATFTLSGGATWAYHADYCGELDGDEWRGEGTFTFTTPPGDTLTGWFTDSATLPSEGEPYDLVITGGTGAYARALGTCHLDNQLVSTGLGAQDQSGDFSCRVAVPAPVTP
ncbi:MAG TPA: hypothetical protein VFI47_17440 [Acidimicrobiales bacterium]|nr:hypothetical protein [Acidimicrobiales bacterium]